MQGQLEKIDEIELKIRQLVGKLKLLREENLSLLEKNSLLIKEKENLKINIEELSSKVSPAKEVKINHNGDLFVKQELRGEIDSYIEEIDKCIEILKMN